MKDNILAPIAEGFKDSIRLSVGIPLAVISVFSSFMKHSLTLGSVRGESGRQNNNNPSPGSTIRS